MFSKEILQEPTDFNPFNYGDINLYSNYGVLDGRKFYYKDITNIFYFEEKNTINGITNIHNARVEVYFSDNSRFEIDFNANMFQQKGKMFKRLEFLVNFLRKTTFDQRLLLYINQLKTTGSFSIIDIKFSNNGDIYDEEKYIGNIRKAFSENKLIDGSSFSTYKSSKYNPYVFGINLGTSFFGIKENNWVILLCIDRDVFNALILNLYKTGYFIL